MTITLNLPEELVASLKSQAEREHVEIDAIAKRGIESVVEKSRNLAPSKPDRVEIKPYDEALLKDFSPEFREWIGGIWKILREGNCPPPTDEQLELEKIRRDLR